MPVEHDVCFFIYQPSHLGGTDRYKLVMVPIEKFMGCEENSELFEGNLFGLRCCKADGHKIQDFIVEFLKCRRTMYGTVGWFKTNDIFFCLNHYHELLDKLVKLHFEKTPTEKSDEFVEYDMCSFIYQPNYLTGTDEYQLVFIRSEEFDHFNGNLLGFRSYGYYERDVKKFRKEFFKHRRIINGKPDWFKSRNIFSCLEYYNKILDKIQGYI